MRGREDFNSAIWTLEMRGEGVGYLCIRLRDLDTVDDGDSLGMAGTELDPTLSSFHSETTNGSVPSGSNTLEARRLRVMVSVLVPTRPVDLYGVLLDFLGTIVEAVEKSV